MEQQLAETKMLLMRVNLIPGTGKYSRVAGPDDAPLVETANEDYNSDLKYRFICWISAIVMTYCSLFFIGYTIFQEWRWALLNFILLILALIVLLRAMRKIEVFKS